MGGGEAGVHDAPPLVRLQPAEGLVADDPRIVDDDIQAAETATALANEMGDVSLPGEVGLDQVMVAPGLLQLTCEIVDVAPILPVAGQDVRAGTGESTSDFPANSAGPPGHESLLAGKRHIHCRILVRWCLRQVSCTAATTFVA